MQASPAEFPNRESQSPGKESVPPTDVDVLPSTSPPFSPTASPSRVANTLPGANTMTNGSIPNGSEAQAVSTTPQASHSTIPTTEASRDSHDAIPTLRPHTADSSAPASPGWESSAETPVDACNIRTSSTATNGQATPEPSPSPQRTDLAADAVQTGTGEGHGACGDFDDDVGDFAEGADEDGAEEAPKVEAAGGGVPGGDGGGRAGAVTAAASNEDGVGQDDFDDDFGDFEEGDGDAGAGATAAAAAAPVGSGAGSGVAGDASTAGRAGGVNVGDVQGSAAMQQFLQDLASMLPEDTWGDESGEGAEEEDAAVRLKRIAGDAEVPAAGAGACAATHRAALLRLLGLSEAAAAAEAAAEEDAAAERIGSVVDGGVSSTGGPAAASPRATVLSPRAAAASPRAAVASPRASPRGPAELARSVSTSDPFGAAAAVEQQQPGARPHTYAEFLVGCFLCLHGGCAHVLLHTLVAAGPCWRAAWFGLGPLCQPQPPALAPLCECVFRCPLCHALVYFTLLFPTAVCRTTFALQTNAAQPNVGVRDWDASRPL